MRVLGAAGVAARVTTAGHKSTTAVLSVVSPHDHDTGLGVLSGSLLVLSSLLDARCLGEAPARVAVPEARPAAALHGLVAARRALDVREIIAVALHECRVLAEWQRLGDTSGAPDGLKVIGLIATH
jgi:hypothetical protein